MSLAEIHAAIPHRAPFLFVDEIVSRDEKRIVCRKTFRETDWFFAGHYPHFPLTPGVVLCEAAMQAGAILLAQIDSSIVDAVPVVARLNNVRFKRVVKPGETIEMEVELTHRVSKVYYLTAKVTCGGKVSVRFDFTCTMAPMT